MPQKRKRENKPLPRGWRWKNGWLWFRTNESNKHHWDNRSEFPLGKTLAEAHQTFGKRVAISDNCRTMNQLLTRYRLETLPEKAYKTREQRSASLPRLITAFGDLRPTEIEPHMVYKYMNHVSKIKSKKIANTDLECLSHALSEAVRWGELKRNPIKGQVQKFTLKGRKHKISNEDLFGFASVIPRKWALYISLKLCTRGRRKGELLRIRLSDLKEEGIEFQNNKNPDDAYLVEWTPELRAIVTEILSLPPRRIGSAHLFVNKHGQPYIDEDGKTYGFNTSWRRYMIRALEKGVVSKWFRENDLRAKSIEGESLMRAQELLRHTSAKTTKKHYTIMDRVKSK